jgi:hypothetical protein
LWVFRQQFSALAPFRTPEEKNFRLPEAFKRFYWTVAAATTASRSHAILSPQPHGTE